MIFQYDLEPVLIWRILIGFAAILEIIKSKFGLKQFLKSLIINLTYSRNKLIIKNQVRFRCDVPVVVNQGGVLAESLFN